MGEVNIPRPAPEWGFARSPRNRIKIQTGYAIKQIHCVKSLRIRSFSCLYFPAFELNTKRYKSPFDAPKLRALRTHVPTCLACLRAIVPTCLACLRDHVPKCAACLRTHVPTCLACFAWSRANVLCVPTCSRAITTNNKNKFSITCFPYILVIVLCLFPMK